MKDKGKKEGKKIMKLPRFSYQLPEDLTPAFLKEMEEDFRESPGELVTAIIRRHFQKKSEEKILRHFATESSDPGAIPYVGPQPNVESDAPKQAHSEDE